MRLFKNLISICLFDGGSEAGIKDIFSDRYDYRRIKK